jgi:hypothetical protein
MHVSRLRAHETSMSRVFFRPQTCGTHTLVAVAGPSTAVPDTARTTVDVTLDLVAATDALISSTTSLGLPKAAEAPLVTRLNPARLAFAHHFPRVGVNLLKAFIGEVEVQRGTTLTDTQADGLIGQAKVIISCV